MADTYDKCRQLEAENAALKAGYSNELGVVTKKFIAAQHRIKVLREAILSVLCDPKWRPCFKGSDGDRKVIADALALPDSTAELDALVKDAEKWREWMIKELQK